MVETAGYGSGGGCDLMRAEKADHGCDLTALGDDFAPGDIEVGLGSIAPDV